MKSTYATTYLGKMVQVIVDRPMGSTHPKHDYTYPINYGYIPDTKAPDGHEIDVYILGVDTPIESFQGTCVAVIQRKDDDDDKCIVVPEGMDISDKEIEDATYFQEHFFVHQIIRG